MPSDKKEKDTTDLQRRSLLKNTAAATLGLGAMNAVSGPEAHAEEIVLLALLPIGAGQDAGERRHRLPRLEAHAPRRETRAAADAPKTPLQKKYGDYFAACMNEDLADKLGARRAIIFGENEIAADEFAVKDMGTGEQEKVSAAEIEERLDNWGKEAWGFPWGPGWGPAWGPPY